MASLLFTGLSITDNSCQCEQIIDNNTLILKLTKIVLEDVVALDLHVHWKFLALTL